MDTPSPGAATVRRRRPARAHVERQLAALDPVELGRVVAVQVFAPGLAMDAFIP
jgi:hypothetical protein